MPLYQENAKHFELLPTVSVSGGTTLVRATHAGKYLICAGNVTLPSTSTAGEHYTILNTTGGNITVARNGNQINGATELITDLNNNYQKIQTHLSNGAEEFIKPELRLALSKETETLENLAPKDINDLYKPKDYADKKPNEESSLSETYGLKTSDISEGSPHQPKI